MGNESSIRSCPDHGSRWIDTREEIEVVSPLSGEHTRRLNPNFGRCTRCHAQHQADRVGRRAPQPKREPQLGDASDIYYRPIGDFKAEEFLQWYEKLESDPVRLAMLRTEARRPSGVSRERHTIAAHRACREPMLNADARTVTRALALSPHAGETRGKLPKGKPFRYVLVKPNALQAAREAGGWMDREWTVYTLKYTRGLVIVDHRGNESRVFSGFGEVRKAIERAGWRVIR